MPLFVFGMSIAEPSSAFRTVHGRRGVAWLIAGRHRLTQSLHVLVLFHFSSSRRAAILNLPHYPFISKREKNRKAKPDSGRAAWLKVWGSFWHPETFYAHAS